MPGSVTGDHGRLTVDYEGTNPTMARNPDQKPDERGIVI